jgi:ribosomal protein L11 methyltransferase
MNPAPGPSTPSVEAVQDHIRACIEAAGGRMTARAAEDEIRRRFLPHRKTARQMLRRLVQNGGLAYADELGTAFITLSRHMAARVSRRIVVRPSEAVNPELRPDDIQITLPAGAAFGDGFHPTTRLALCGLEFLIDETGFLHEKPAVSTLDIGAGSGILGVAALLMGAAVAFGVDPDENALFEAAENIRRNGLSDRYVVVRGSLTDVRKRWKASKNALFVGKPLRNDRFDLVLANLRYPTLCRLPEALAGLISEDAAWVVSGVRPAEGDLLVSEYAGAGLHPCFTRDLGGWRGMVFRGKHR